MMIDLSIVIITWNSKKLLVGLLESIYKYTSQIFFEIILIDNNSSDGTSKHIETNYPDIVLIKNNSNKGVAPARNQGLKIAKGKYIAILDSDIELIENSLLKLFQYMEQNSDCGLVGAKLLESDLRLQHSCKNFPNFLSLIFRRFEHLSLIKNSKTLKEHIMFSWDHNSILEVDYVIGACQFFRKEVINKIGFYDDKIFYGPEDIDFCLRVWRAGWKVIYFPETFMIHHCQRITKKNLLSDISIKHFKAILYIFWKYKFNLSR